MNHELACSDIFPTGTEITTTAFKVQSTDEFKMHVIINSGITKEGFLAFPDSTLGMEYYVLTYCAIGGLCQFSVTPVENDTSILVTFANSVDLATVCITGDSASSSGSEIPVTLNEYDVMHIESSQDLSGTWITSNKSVAVFAGARDVPSADGTLSAMIEQLLPVSKWGKEFIVSPNADNNAGDIVKMISRVSNTEVHITGYSPFVMPEVAGTVTRRIDWDMDSKITASSPILVIQLMSIDLYSQPSSVSGRPRMLLVPAVTQATDEHYMQCSTPSVSPKVVMFVDSASTGIINSSLASTITWKDSKIQATDTVVGELNITTAAEVKVTGTKFGAYGYCAENIAVLTGIDLTAESEKCHPTVMAPGDDVDNDCDGHTDEDNCTSADLHLKVGISPDGGELATHTLETGGRDYILFTILSCYTGVVTLGEPDGSKDKVVFQISDHDVVIEICTPSCDIVVQKDFTYGPVTCDDERAMWIRWQSSTLSVGKGGLSGVGQITEGESPDKQWSYIDTMTFSTIGGNTTFSIDTSAKDCSKVYAGTANSLGKDFIVPVTKDDMRFSILIVTRVLSNVSVLPMPPSDGDTPTAINVQANNTRVINRTDIAFDAFSSLHITSSAEVSVYLIDANQAGLHIVPTDVLGPTYTLAVSETTAPNTVCTIAALSKQVVVSGENIEAYSVTQVPINASNDPRRNLLHSTKPVAVFCTMPEATSASSLVQITPREILGTTYYIPPIDLAECGNAVGSIKITSTEDSTHVAIHGGYDRDHAISAAGDVIKQALQTNQLVNITANKPILVTLLITGLMSDWMSASIIPSTDQYTDEHVFPSWSAGEVLAYSAAVGDNGSEVTTQIVRLATSGVQIIQYPTPTFSISVLKHASGKFFLVQSDRKYEDINEVCHMSPSTSVDDIDNDCDGLTNEESCTSLNTPGQIDFDIDGSINEDCYDLNVNLTTVVTISLPSTAFTCTTTTETHTPAPTPAQTTTATATTTPDSSGCCCGSSVTPTNMTDANITFGVTWVMSGTVTTNVSSTEAPISSTVTTGTTTTTAAPVETCRTDCVCPCAWSTNVTLTPEEVEELVVEIQEKLKVNKALLSATIRKLTSAKDDRPSAVSIGYIGLAFLVVTLGTVFLLDLTTIVQDLHLLRDNLRAVFEV